MDEDDEDIIIIEDDPIEVVPAPWHNSDTVAASFMFASNMAAAAAHHFSQLAFLALGQSMEEWAEVEKRKFRNEVSAAIDLLTENTTEGDTNA